MEIKTAAENMKIGYCVAVIDIHQEEMAQSKQKGLPHGPSLRLQGDKNPVEKVDR